MKLARFWGTAVLAVLIAAALLSGCSGAGGSGIQPADDPEPAPPAHSLLGTWTAPSTCTISGVAGTGTLTMTFGETLWYVYRYCATPSRAFRYRASGGSWAIDGDTVTRTRAPVSGGDTAIKVIDWAEDGESFETHPFHWAADDSPTSLRTYSLVSRDTLPVTGIEGSWYRRYNRDVLERYTFNPDGTFESWSRYTRRNDDGTAWNGTITTTGVWRPGDPANGTLLLSRLEMTGEDEQFPGITIRSSSSAVAELGIAPGPNPEALVIWVPIGHVPASNLEDFDHFVPTSMDGAAYTIVKAFVR